VPTPTDGNRELLTVIAFMRAAAGEREELMAALEALIEPTKQDPSAERQALIGRSTDGRLP
jgi:hypothetical protein